MTTTVFHPYLKQTESEDNFPKTRIAYQISIISIKNKEMITDRNHKNQTVMEEKDSRMVILADTLSAIIAATIATYTA